jgi:hypothetical protein
MEDATGLLSSIAALIAMLIAAFALFRSSRAGDGAKKAREAIKRVTDAAHAVVIVDAEEDHEEVTEAVASDDPAAAVAALLNDRED